jgi:PKD repeat protein
MKILLTPSNHLTPALVLLALFSWVSQSGAATCQSNCLSLWSLKLTDLGTSISASAKFVDEFGSSGASRQSTVRGRWTRPDGSVLLQSTRIGTRLRADFKLTTGGIAGLYTFEIVDVVRTGYTYDPSLGEVPLASIDITTSSNQAPVAVLNSDVTSGSAPLTVNFNGSGSYDPDGETIHYLWNFGDGTTSSSANPSHTYQVGGEFIATLTVLDDLGASSKSLARITVVDSSGNPGGNISCQSQCASVKKYKLEYKSDKNLLKGYVWIEDENDQILRDLTVKAIWTLPDNSLVAQTSSIGTRKRASFKIPANMYGVYSLTVESVNKSGYTYDPDSNIADSESYEHKF